MIRVDGYTPLVRIDNSTSTVPVQADHVIVLLVSEMVLLFLPQTRFTPLTLSVDMSTW